MPDQRGVATAPDLDAGRRALSIGAWDDARAAFEVALAGGETPEALEGLSWAAWWLNDADVMFEARERAFRRYRQLGDRRGAARIALWLASDHLDFRGEEAIASGWRERARRLLDGLSECPEHGWLALIEGAFALEVAGDPAEARDLGLRAAKIGLRLGVIDLQMLGLAVEGLALVTQGEVRDGMRRLDEAVAAAIGGEFGDVVSILWATCYLIYACERVRDYEREAQWCRRVEELAGRLRIRQLLGECRVHYGGVLMWRGEWREAAAQLERAAEDFEASRPLAMAESVARLGDLRRRQGRMDEARRLLGEVEGHPLADLVRAHLDLDRGDARRAADRAGRALRMLDRVDRTARAPWLEVAALARAALGDSGVAADDVTDLRTIAEAVGTLPFRASAAFCEGVVAAAAGDSETARRRLEEATDLYARSAAPFETARSRIELARCLWAIGRTDTAIEEAESAREALDELGAGAESARAAELLRELRAPGAEGTSGERFASLTSRQVAVLGLVAEGMSDKEVARELTLSEHTVHRHIANILSRLDVASRAAAVARAKEHGLL
jgi:DNA-binding NarL/FixJ family response regulator